MVSILKFLFSMADRASTIGDIAQPLIETVTSDIDKLIKNGIPFTSIDKSIFRIMIGDAEFAKIYCKIHSTEITVEDLIELSKYPHRGVLEEVVKHPLCPEEIKFLYEMEK